MPVKRVLRLRNFVIAAIFGASIASGTLLYFAYGPVPNEPQALAPPLVALDEPEGKQRMSRSLSSDFEQIQPFLEPQKQRALCGVASIVSIVNANDRASKTNQDTILQDDVSRVKNPFIVHFSGLTLSDVHGSLLPVTQKTDVFFASNENTEKFRGDIKRTLQDPHVMMLVNFSRKSLGQVGSGHISPIGAYDAETDSVLLMDVAIHKYPFTWIPVSKLFDAMNTVDSDAHKSRGWLLATF